MIKPPNTDFERERKIWLKGLLTPISFYGKVIDEKGHPIAGATAEIGVNDKAISGTTYYRTSGPMGLFSLTDVHGLSVAVLVSKEGYYRVKRSSEVYGYAEGMSNDGPIPTLGHPAIFVLQKKGQAAALIANTIKVGLPKNGKAIGIQLSTGRVTSSTEGDLRIEYSVEEQAVYHTYHPYEWKVRISVPNGGLAKRTGDLDFTAPADGYEAFEEIDMPKTALPRWAAQISRQYFLRLGDDTYARIELRVISGQDNFALVTFYLNPTPGDPNLEYDPSKRVTPH